MNIPEGTDFAAAERHMKKMALMNGGHPGALMIVASYGQHPGTGEDLKPRVEHVRVGPSATTDAMRAIRLMAQEPFRNVYAGTSVMAPICRGVKRAKRHT